MQFKTLKENDAQRNERRTVSGALTEFINFGPMSIMQESLENLTKVLKTVLDAFEQQKLEEKLGNFPELNAWNTALNDLTKLTALPAPKAPKVLNDLYNMTDLREAWMTLGDLKVLKILKALTAVTALIDVPALEAILKALEQDLKELKDDSGNETILSSLNKHLEILKKEAEQPLSDLDTLKFFKTQLESDLEELKTTVKEFKEQNPKDWISWNPKSQKKLMAFLTKHMSELKSAEIRDLATLQVIVSKVRDEVLQGLVNINDALCQLDGDWYKGLNSNNPATDTRPKYLYFYLKGGNAYKGANLRGQLHLPKESRKDEFQVFPEELGDSDFDSQVIINPSLPLSLQQEIIANIEEIVTYHLQETANKISEVIEQEWGNADDPSLHGNANRKEDIAYLLWHVLDSCKGNGLLKGKLEREKLPLNIQDPKTMIAALPSKTGVRLDMLDVNWNPGALSPSVSINDSINPFIIYRLGYKWKVDEAVHETVGNIIALRKSFLMELIDVTIPRPGSLEASEMWRSFFPLDSSAVGFRNATNKLKVKSSVDDTKDFPINNILPNLHYHMAEQLLMIGEVADGSSRSANKFWKRIKRSFEIWESDKENLTHLIKDTGLTHSGNRELDPMDDQLEKAIKKAGNPGDPFLKEIKLYYQKVKKENSGSIEALKLNKEGKDSIDAFIAKGIKKLYNEMNKPTYSGFKWPKVAEKGDIEFLRCDQSVFDRLAYDYVKDLTKLPFDKVMSMGYVISWPWFLADEGVLFRLAKRLFESLQVVGEETGNVTLISEDRWTLKVENNSFNAYTAIFDHKGKKVVITATTASPRQLGTTITLSPPSEKLKKPIDINNGDCDVKFLQRQTNPEVYIRMLHQVGLQVHAYSMVGAVKTLKDSLDYRIS